MATTRKPTPADENDYFVARDERLGAARATDCAACHAPLPDGNRYLCEACVADSGERARALLEGLPGAGGAPSAATPAADDSLASDADDALDCPNCGMRLDPSGRCGGCVTTIRR